MPISICIATNILGLGGAERTVETLALGLPKDEFIVTVLAMEAGGPREKTSQAGGVRVLVGDGSVEKLKQLVRQGEFDVLHFHRSGHTENLHTELVKYAQAKKVMETNVFAFEDKTLSTQFAVRVYKSMMMLTQRAWNGVLPKDLGAYTKQRVIYNPVTIESFQKNKISAEERQTRRAALGILPTDIVCTRVGRDDVVKWGDMLLLSIPLLARIAPQVKWVLRTVPKSRMAWLKKKGYLGSKVIVLPETADEKEIAATYQIADIYTHTTRRGEAFGNTLNEAMVWGLPIVAENTPHWDNGQVEQVLHQKTGLLVNSLPAFCKSVADLAVNSDLRKEYGVAGKKYVESFALQNGIFQYALTYKFLCGKINAEEYTQNMKPSVQEVQSFGKEYSKLCTNTYISAVVPFVVRFGAWVQAVLWRVGDSLRGRGIWG